MDATFRVVPMGKFHQLFILYIRKNQKVVYIYVVIVNAIIAFLSSFANDFLFTIGFSFCVYFNG